MYDGHLAFFGKPFDSKNIICSIRLFRKRMVRRRTVLYGRVSCIESIVYVCGSTIQDQDANAASDSAYFLQLILLQIRAPYFGRRKFLLLCIIRFRPKLIPLHQPAIEYRIQPFSDIRERRVPPCITNEIGVRERIGIKSV